LSLSYAAGDGPPSVFVKMPGRLLHRLALVALGALATEARLADSGATLPLEHPRPFAAGINQARLAAVVVMDDVAVRGGRPNDATTALSPDEVASGLEGLARLHAAFWGRPVPASLAFLRPWILSGRLAPVSAASLGWAWRRLERVGRAGLIPAGLGPLVLERQFRHSTALTASGPQTVLHGDPHPGNTYTLPDGRLGFYDWQLVRLGRWSHDVGYFVVGSLSVEDRRNHEEPLLRTYLAGLAAAGVEGLAFDEAWRWYRASPAFGLATWMHTLGAGSFQPLDVCLATVERFATAYADLDTGRTVVATG
jgi:hypothetical protein